MSKWMGPTVCSLLVAVGIIQAAGLVGTAGDAISLLIIGGGVVWALTGGERLRHVSGLYLWLALPLSGLLEVLSARLAGITGDDTLTVYRIVSVAHLLLIASATWALGSWKDVNDISYPMRLAAGLFLVGAVVFWSGATTFPGMTLVKIAAQGPAHMWTSATFLLAAAITLAGLSLFTVALHEAGDRFLSLLGLLASLLGTGFWSIHLVFRLTIMPWAAAELSRSGAPPAWFEPWRNWAGLFFGLYHVLAYLSLIAYGIALLRTGLLSGAAGWMCILFGVCALPWFGPPLLIQVMPWIIGTLVLTRPASSSRRGLFAGS